MLIQLVKACTDSNEVIHDKWMMPLDLCSLATCIKYGFPYVDIEILDGQLMTEDELLTRLNPNALLVGLTYTVFSVRSMERIANIAKRNGSLVVVGGQAATASAENLVSSPNVDVVIRHDGEVSLCLLVDQIVSRRNPLDLASVQNSVFREGEKVRFGKACVQNILNVPAPLREVGKIHIEDYLKEYPATCSEKKLLAFRPTNAYSKKGCSRSCSFCGRVDKSLRMRSPETVYNEYADLNSTYGIDYIYDHSDTWIDKEWIDAFQKIYIERGSLNLKYMIFGDVRDIDSTIADCLKALGVDIILLGVESGCEELLRANEKPLYLNQIISCITMLANVGIKVSASFVLGLMGENEKSISDTLHLIDEIRSCGNVTVYCNVIIPLPGSRIWKKMMEDWYFRCQFGDKYHFDIDALRKYYIDHFTRLPSGISYLTRIRDQILKDEGMPILEYVR